jgi:metallo-beta-lactamase class B
MGRTDALGNGRWSLRFGVRLAAVPRMRSPLLLLLSTALALGALPSVLTGQTPDSAAPGYTAKQCPPCADWNARHVPQRIFGNVYYVGTKGLSAILVTSPNGHILLDGGLPESATSIVSNMRRLGFRIEDVRLILNSHPHYDHAGGIAELQRLSGARVAASPSSALVLERGTPGSDDPQYTIALPYPAVSAVKHIRDGETLYVGRMPIVAHFTPGHTPGGTSWSWRSCQDDRCLDFVYADSFTPVSAEGFSFSSSTAYPTALADFAHGFALLESLPCDVLLTPHPGASRIFERLMPGEDNGAPELIDPTGCRRYVANARSQLERRLEDEQKK